MARKKSNHIIEKIPLALIGAVLLQFATTIWWAASLDSRVSSQEDWINDNGHISERVYRLEEQVEALKEEENDLERRVNAWIIRR